MMTRRAALLGIVLVVAALPASAQKLVVPAAKCDRADTNASWYRHQAEWWALDAKHDWSNDSLRTQLLSVGSLLRPSARDAFPIQYGAVSDRFVVRNLSIDQISEQLTAIRQVLRDMAQKRAWPVRSLVGSAGVAATWSVIAGDSALMSTGMHRFMEAGPGEVSAVDVAVAEDWLRIRTGRKQIYGTQLAAVAGAAIHAFQPLPTEDLAHVNLRRDAAGLPPLATALCWAAKQPSM